MNTHPQPPQEAQPQPLPAQGGYDDGFGFELRILPRRGLAPSRELDLLHGIERWRTERGLIGDVLQTRFDFRSPERDLNESDQAEVLLVMMTTPEVLCACLLPDDSKAGWIVASTADPWSQMACQLYAAGRLDAASLLAVLPRSPKPPFQLFDGFGLTDEEVL